MATTYEFSESTEGLRLEGLPSEKLSLAFRIARASSELENVEMCYRYWCSEMERINEAQKKFLEEEYWPARHAESMADTLADVRHAAAAVDRMESTAMNFAREVSYAKMKLKEFSGAFTRLKAEVMECEQLQRIELQMAEQARVMRLAKEECDACERAALAAGMTSLVEELEEEKKEAESEKERRRAAAKKVVARKREKQRMEEREFYRATAPSLEQARAPPLQPFQLPIEGLELCDSYRSRLAWCIVYGIEIPGYDGRKSAGLLREEEKFTPRELKNYRRVFEQLKGCDEPQGLTEIMGAVKDRFSELLEYISKQVSSAFVAAGNLFTEGIVQRFREVFSKSYSSLMDLFSSAATLAEETLGDHGLTAIVQLIFAAFFGCVCYFMPVTDKFFGIIKGLIAMVAGFCGTKSLLHLLFEVISRLGYGSTYTAAKAACIERDRLVQNGRYVVTEPTHLTSMLLSVQAEAIPEKPVFVSLYDQEAGTTYSREFPTTVEFMKWLKVGGDAVDWKFKAKEPETYFPFFKVAYAEKNWRHKHDAMADEMLSLAVEHTEVERQKKIFTSPSIREEDYESAEEMDVAQGQPGVIEVKEVEKKETSDVASGMSNLFKIFGVTLTPVAAMRNVVDLGRVLATAKSAISAVSAVIKWFIEAMQGAMGALEGLLGQYRAWQWFQGTSELWDKMLKKIDGFLKDQSQVLVPANAKVVMEIYSEIQLKRWQGLETGKTQTSIARALDSMLRVIEPLVEIAAQVVARPDVRVRPENLILVGGSQTSKSSLLAPMIGQRVVSTALGRKLEKNEIARPPLADEKFPFAGSKGALVYIGDDVMTKTSKEEFAPVMQMMFALGGAQVAPIASPEAEEKGKNYLESLCNIFTENHPCLHLVPKVTNNPDAFVARWKVYAVLIVMHVEEAGKKYLRLLDASTAPAGTIIKPEMSAEEVKAAIDNHYRFYEVPLMATADRNELKMVLPETLHQEKSGFTLVKNNEMLPIDHPLIRWFKTMDELIEEKAKSLKLSIEATKERAKLLEPTEVSTARIDALFAEAGWDKKKFLEPIEPRGRDQIWVDIVLSPDEVGDWNADAFEAVRNWHVTELAKFVQANPKADTTQFIKLQLNKIAVAMLKRKIKTPKAESLTELMKKQIEAAKRAVEIYMVQIKGSFTGFVMRPIVWVPLALLAVSGTIGAIMWIMSSSSPDEGEDEEQSFDVRMRPARVEGVRPLLRGQRRGGMRRDVPQGAEQRYAELMKKKHHVVGVRISHTSGYATEYQGLMLNECTVLTALHGVSPIFNDMKRTTVTIIEPAIWSYVGKTKAIRLDQLFTDEMRAAFLKEMTAQGVAITADPLVDIVALSLSYPLKGYRDISKMFIPWAQFSDLVGRDIMRISLNPDLGWEQDRASGKITACRAVSISTPELEDGMAFSTVYNFQTNITGIAGQCGAPVAIMDDHVQGLFAGIHTGANSEGQFYFAPIPREVVEQLLKLQPTRADVETAVDRGIIVTDVPQGRRRMVFDGLTQDSIPVFGFVPTEQVQKAIVTAPRIHDFMRVPFADKLKEFASHRVPSNLHAWAYPVGRSHPGHSTAKKALLALSKKVNLIQEPEYEREFISCLMQKCVFTGVPIALSAKEVVNGNELLPGFDMNASAGSDGLPDKRTKKFWFDPSFKKEDGTYVPNKECKELWRRAQDAFNARSYEPGLITAVKKSEPIEVEKQHLTRSFFPMPLSAQIMEKQIFGPVAMVFKKSAYALGSAIGMNPEQMSAMYEDGVMFARTLWALGEPVKMFGEDAIANDLTISHTNHLIFSRFCLKVLHTLMTNQGLSDAECEPHLAKAGRLLWTLSQGFIAVEDADGSYKVLHVLMNFSGRWLTSIFNDITKQYQYFCVWRKKWPGDYGVIGQHNRFWSMTYSDDGIVAFADPDEFIALLNETSGPKHKLDSKNFCGRSPRPCSQGFRLVLNFPAICQMVTFISRKGSRQKNWFQNLDQAFNELVFYPKAESEKLLAIVRGICQERDWPLYVPPYDRTETRSDVASQLEALSIDAMDVDG